MGTIIGQRGTGKTLFFLGSKYSAKASDQALNIPGFIDTAIKNGFKVLIIDTMDHPAYKRIPVMQPKQFAGFRTGIYRTWLPDDQMRQFVNKINHASHFNNTLLVFEDAGKYTEGKLPPEFKKLIIESKQRNIDIVFMYHCWIDTPSNIFTKSDYIQLFKTEDSPYCRRNRIRLYDKVFEVHQQVQKHPSRFYSRFIDTRTN